MRYRQWDHKESDTTEWLTFSLQSILNFNNCVIHFCLFFISSMSLVIMLTVLIVSFLLMGGAVFPPCSLAWGHSMVGAMAVMAASFNTQASQDCRGQRCWPRSRPLLTHASARDRKHTQASLAQSLVGSLLLSPGFQGTQGFVCAFQEPLFPQFCGSSVTKSCWPSKSDSLEVHSPFAGSPGCEVCHGA